MLVDNGGIVKVKAFVCAHFLV